MESSFAFADRFTKAERELQAARAFGYGPRKFYVSSHLQKDALEDEPKVKRNEDKDPSAPPPEKTPQAHAEEDKRKINRIYIAVTSDRGLCGGVHSGVTRRIRHTMTGRSAEPSTHKLICIGEKSRTMLKSTYSQHILLSVKQIGRVSPIFKDASSMAVAITESGYKYESAEIYYNKYHTPVKYETTVIPAFTRKNIERAPNMAAFDDVEEDQLESYAEWTLAAIIYYALKQSAASEQSSRMAAMDNATKNAAEMIRKLSLLYNRTRQSVITKELIEILSGAAALK
ncbi:unnamed protein product, partial [Iphiclides podalirius]